MAGVPSQNDVGSGPGMSEMDGRVSRRYRKRRSPSPATTAASWTSSMAGDGREGAGREWNAFKRRGDKSSSSYRRRGK